MVLGVWGLGLRDVKGLGALEPKRSRATVSVEGCTLVLVQGPGFWPSWERISAFALQM